MNKTYFLCLSLIFFLNCYTEKTKEINKIINYIEFRTEILIKKSIADADLIGVSRENEEVYIKKLFQKDNFWTLQIFDFQGKKKRDIKLKKGPGESPDSFCNPILMRRVKDSYILLDHVYKIVVLTNDFSIKNTFMFFSYRFLVDFFYFNEPLCIYLEKIYSNKAVICKINLYRFGISKLEKKKEIYKYNMKYPVSETKSRSYLNKNAPVEFIWETPYSIYKEGFIYLNLSSNNQLIKYGIKNNEFEKINLNFLKAKNYTKKVVQTIGLLYSSNEDLNHYRDLKGMQYDYIPFGKKLYHLGMYDMGTNKIGFITNINIETKQFRTDVFNANNFEYIRSIWFPLCTSYLANLQYINPYGYTTFIDLEKKILVNYDKKTDSSSDDYNVNIINFKLLKVNN